MMSPWLRRAVTHSWDSDTNTAVAGAEWRTGGAGADEEYNLMRVLEFGGRYRLAKKARGRRIRRGKPNVVVTVRARPYMLPALERERPRLAEPWLGSIRGG